MALATPDVTLRKTSKPALAKKLKKDLPPAESTNLEILQVSIDGIALVQRVEANHMYFSDVSKQFSQRN